MLYYILYIIIIYIIYYIIMSKQKLIPTGAFCTVPQLWLRSERYTKCNYLNAYIFRLCKAAHPPLFEILLFGIRLIRHVPSNNIRNTCPFILPTVRTPRYNNYFIPYCIKKHF